MLMECLYMDRNSNVCVSVFVSVGGWICGVMSHGLVSNTDLMCCNHVVYRPMDGGQIEK